MSRKAGRSGAEANAPLSGDRADNPDVSVTSRFWDQVWDFSNEDANPAMGSHDKRVLAQFRCNPALTMISQLNGLGWRLAQLSVCLRKRRSAAEVLLAWLVWRCQRSTSSSPSSPKNSVIDESSPQQHPTRFMDLSYQSSARVTLTGAGPAPSGARSPLVRTSDA
jgi:hypothetical protein